MPCGLLSLKLKILRPDILTQVAAQQGMVIEENSSAYVGGSRRTGLVVHIPGMTDPVVIDRDGTLYYGRYSDMAPLNRLIQQYVGGVVVADAQAQGQYVWQEETEDERLVLHVSVGGW